MGTKDTLLEVAAVSRRWISLPKRTMTDQLTSVDKRVRLPLGITLLLSTAVAACARISSELPNTTGPVVDNGSRVATASPTNEVLGVQFNEVAVWDKATLAIKDANISAQIDALSSELKRQRPELFVGSTQLDSFAISVPVKDMTGKKTNTIYPFIVGNNQTDRSKSFVTIVLRRIDGQGIFAQSLTPIDITVDGQQHGALVLQVSDAEQLPVFIFPKSLKDWNAQSDAQKVSSDVIFIPPTGEKVRIPLSGGKLASPAVYNAQVGYATPGFNPDLATKASATDFYKTLTPTATNTPTVVAEHTAIPNPNVLVTKPIDGYVWNGDGNSFSALSPDMSLNNFGSGKGERYTFELAPTKIFLGEDKRIYIQGKGYNGSVVLIPVTEAYLFYRETGSSKKIESDEISGLVIPKDWTVSFQIYPNGEIGLDKAKIAQILATNQFGDKLLMDKRIVGVLGSRP